MKRDLVFFVSGLSFGIATGYLLFRAISPPGGGTAGTAAPKGPGPLQSSTIGLDDQAKARSVDEEKVSKLEAKAKENADDSDTRAEIGNLYMDARRWAEAVSWLEQAVRLRPGDLHLRNHLAICYLNEGKVDEAVGIYEQSLVANPNDPPSLLGLGRIKLYLKQDIRGGLNLWEKLSQVAPNSAEAAAVKDELEALKSAHSGS